MSHPTLHLIGGPTASGKSALALRLAREVGGVVINADALQVYRGLPILTAQPEIPPDVPHELYAIFDPAEKSSAGIWLEQAQIAIKHAVSAGKTAIVVGGTGLYFRALLGGLDDIPPIPESARQAAQELYDGLGSEGFRTELAKHDPAAATRIKPNDRQRLIRAYEVVAHTGRTLDSWHDKNKSPNIGILFHMEHHLLLPPREALYAACDARFLQMLERGALDEVRQLKARNLDPTLPALKVLGYRELAAHLDGALTLAEATQKAQQATRNYAKRQITWFRNQWSDVAASAPAE